MAVDYFQPESFEQANPVLSGMNAAQQLFSQGMQNAYLPQNLQAQLAMLRAQTATQQALPGYYGALGNEANARGGLFGAQGNLLRQQTPYLVQQAQVGAYPDPIMSRGVQLQNAQRTGAVSPQYLSFLGLGNSQNGNSQTPMGANNLQNQAQLLRSPNQPGMTQQPGGIPMTPQQQRTLAMLQQGMQSGQQGPVPTNYNVSSVGAPPQNSNSFSGTNPLQNYAVFGSPMSPVQMMQLKAMGEGMNTQATTGVTQYNAAQDKASQDANLGTQLSQLTTQFQKAYKDSNFTGGVLGKAPTTGLESVPARLAQGIQGKNLAPEQAADNASQNMAALVAKMIAGGRVTNYEMQYINNLKPNRMMDPQTAQMASDFLQQKSIRMKEGQDFLTAARNQGVPVQVANSLWQQYNNQRPVYDFANSKPNAQFQNGWKPYLSQQAVSSMQSGQPFISIPSGMTSKQGIAWFNSLNPGDQVIARQELLRQKSGGNQ